MKQGKRNRDPWAAKRCPGTCDPDPADTSANACLTRGQIATLQMIYSRYPFASPLANGVKSFGMWLPNTDPGGSGLIAANSLPRSGGRAGERAPHSHLGVLGVTGFLMQDLNANPLDYVEGGRWKSRRAQISEWLDATDPDLSKFAQRGGKMIVTIGTNDTLASPGAQLDYYQSVIDRMGQSKVDAFARLFVIPQTGHGLTGSSYRTSGDGKTLPVVPVPNAWDRLALLFDWVPVRVKRSTSFNEGVEPRGVVFRLAVSTTSGGAIPVAAGRAHVGADRRAQRVARLRADRSG